MKLGTPVLFTSIWLACLSGPGWADPMEDGTLAHQRGEDVQAMKHWLPLAQAGNAEAQFRVGALHEQGSGLLHCNADAFDWYLRSARNGYVSAQLAVARMYNDGLGVARNRREAEKWARAAEPPGVAIARNSTTLP